jgi:hypothetical protein
VQDYEPDFKEIMKKITLFIVLLVVFSCKKEATTPIVIENTTQN